MHAAQLFVFGDLPGRLDAVEHRHLHVDQCGVGLVLFGQRDGLLPVGGLGDHLEIVFGLQQ